MSYVAADPKCDELIQEWVSRQLGVEKLGGDKFSAAAIMSGDEIIGGVIFHDKKGHMIDVSLATVSPKWAAKGVLKDLFAYPFVQLGVERLGAICSKKNKKIRRTMEKLGFKQEGCARKGFGDGSDAIIYGMLKHECKWIK